MLVKAKSELQKLFDLSATSRVKEAIRSLC